MEGKIFNFNIKNYRVHSLRLISQVADTIGKENLKQYKGIF